MLRPYREKAPAAAPTAWLAENASLIGDVRLAPGASVWFGAVLRADHSPIIVGENTNIQDNCVLHGGESGPIILHRDVTVGHAAILHSCTVEDGCIIGMGAILMDGCVIGAGSLVAAGALVTKGTMVPPGSLVMGSPAKVKRPLTPEEAEGNRRSAREYREMAGEELSPAGKVR